MITAEMTLFQVGQKVVWRDNIWHENETKTLSSQKSRLGEGPFTVLTVIDVPEAGRFDAMHSQWLKIDIADSDRKFSGYWFSPAD